jgi:hypothetical protein
MRAEVTITTRLMDSAGQEITTVSTTEVATFGDNPRFLRTMLVEPIQRAESRNLDQVVAVRGPEIARMGGEI